MAEKKNILIMNGDNVHDVLIGPDRDIYASVVDGDKLIAVRECGSVA